MPETENVEVISKPFNFSRFTLDDFEDYTAHKYLYDNFHGNAKIYLLACGEMAKAAKAAGYSGFKSSMKEYAALEDAERLRNAPAKVTDFYDQPLELNCGQWDADERGASRSGKYGIRELACAHPIMPVERLVNIDTGEVKLTLAYKPPGKGKRWRTTIVDKATISTARSITALASQGISVTSTSASALVDYLEDLQNLNYDIIPEKKSIGRLGYIPGEGFSPYVSGLVFDGDASFRNLYNSVNAKGSQTEWYKTALECRKQSVTARIMLAASFASPLLSLVGSLPFFVHLWGVDSGTGKTVALMLAASVWGDPALGSYVQTFNGTQVGQERTAAFLNHLPFCLDELQLTKDSRGKSNFDVYQLAQSVGRARGKRTGGVEQAPTWSCCFLTTGESPLTSASAGAGAVNRVIDIECTAGSAVLTDGQRISGTLKRNYGWAGQMFVEKLYSSEKIQNQVLEMYQDNFRELCAGDSTEKQAMAAAAIITADQMATAWFFKDDMELTVDEIREFLASKEAVSAGRRAYEWLCDWVAANVNHFVGGGELTTGEVYGKIDGDIAYINRGVFYRELQNANFSPPATLSFLKSNGLIEYREGKSLAKSRSINGVKTECIVLHLVEKTWVDDLEDGEMLPL